MSATTPYSDQPAASNKLGLDDYAYLKGEGAALWLIEEAVDSEAYEASVRARMPHPYSARNGAIWKSVTTKDGLSFEIQLTTFIAFIRGQIIESDGVEETRYYEIEGVVNGETRIFTIPASEFRGLGWIALHLGGGAVILAQAQDREVAAAVQLLSPQDALVRVRHTHTGWICHEGRDVFLDAVGAIGGDGRISGVDVALPPQFAHYALEDPGNPEAQVEAIHASFAITKVGPPEQTVPLLAAPYQAVVEQPADSTFICGGSGLFKSCEMALSLQHFGRAMDHLHLTESFSSTITALREVAFRGKDVLIGVDDYSRPPDHYQASDLDAKAEALFRGIGNRAARSRAARDGSLRAARPPRAAVLSSGTQLPPADDVQARLTVVYTRKGAVDRQALSRSQRDGAQGLFAQSMFGFVQWLALNRQSRLDWYHRRVLELRKWFENEKSHPRAAPAMAAKMAALELVIEYACDCSAFNDDQADEWRVKFLAALGDAAESQTPDPSFVEPAERFVSLLRDALAAGRCHISTRAGGMPPVTAEKPDAASPVPAEKPDAASPVTAAKSDAATPLPAEADTPVDMARACGWKEDKLHTTSYLVPAGPEIGFLDGPKWEDLYLNPSESLAVVQKLSQDMKQPLVIGERDLHRRLLEAGYLVFDKKAEREKKSRNTLTVRERRFGERSGVLHLSTPKILGMKKAGDKEDDDR
jgi:hypothetical protein